MTERLIIIAQVMVLIVLGVTLRLRLTMGKRLGIIVVLGKPVAYTDRKLSLGFMSLIQYIGQTGFFPHNTLYGCSSIKINSGLMIKYNGILVIIL